MAIDTTTTTSRRALLTGAFGGVAAAVAGSLGRARPVAAHDPDDVRLGASNSADIRTTIVSTTTDGDAFGGYANGQGIGLYGQSQSGWGVTGWSGLGTGVYGASSSGTGLRGSSHDQVGVYGSSGNDAPRVITLRVGVYGWGPSTSGLAPSYGVIGKSGSAIGVGLLGSCDAGFGVLATSKTGRALSVQGRVEFKTSGIATIPATRPSRVVDPGVPIGNKTRILVTLHGDPGHDIVLQRVAKDVAAGRFNVILTAPAANDCPFSWFLIG
jgi:hypothetical protein